LPFQMEILLVRQSSCYSVTNPSQRWEVHPEEEGRTSCETCPCLPWRRRRHLHQPQMGLKRGQDKERTHHIRLIQPQHLVSFRGRGFEDGVSVQPRLDTVLVPWLSKRSGSVPRTAVSFFRQRFSSIWSRYSSSCCMGLLFLSLAHSGAPSHKE